LRPQDVIRKKRDGFSLSRDEIAFFVSGVARGDIADYQASALLMAIFLNGMNEAEQHDLTNEMLHSGQILNFSDIPKAKADKHSTGGVGDKTSLIIAPAAAAAGLAVPMISGRGLGHTGGTLDKLESIPGYRVDLTLEEFRRVLADVGFAMSGQSADIAPADKKLYALRDATATVEAIPLIVASIMSKKLAAGLDALVLDVKTGSGAFMRDESNARALASALVKTGNAFGVRTEALLTDMNQPLGRQVGNALEVLECIRILRGEIDDLSRPVFDLSVELAARMVALGGVESTLEGARAKVLDALSSGQALERFRDNVIAQGGNGEVCDKPEQILNLTAPQLKVESTRSGFVTRVDTSKIGHAVAALGGGRIRIEDRIDSSVGFAADIRVGDHVRSGDILGLLFCRDSSSADEARALIQEAYIVDDVPPSDNLQLIKEIIVA
jgi:pyrimidine-nucleoside phosphorylase